MNTPQDIADQILSELHTLENQSVDYGGQGPGFNSESHRLYGAMGFTKVKIRDLLQMLVAAASAERAAVVVPNWRTEAVKWLRRRGDAGEGFGNPGHWATVFAEALEAEQEAAPVGYEPWEAPNKFGDKPTPMGRNLGRNLAQFVAEKSAGGATPEGQQMIDGREASRPDHPSESGASPAAGALTLTPEPVAWADPLDIAEDRMELYGCSHRWRMNHDGVRYSMPLYAHPIGSDSRPSSTVCPSGVGASGAPEGEQ